MNTSRTVATSACVLSGAALVIDTVTITAIDRAFDPLDSVLFLVGLAALVVGTVGTSLVLSQGRRPRVAWAVGLGLALVIVVGLVSQLGESLAHALYHGDNVGLRGEWSFFLVGVQMLIVAGYLSRRPSVMSER